MTRLTDRQLEILQHSLGVDHYGQGPRYRNHFCAGEDDEPICRELVELGLMKTFVRSWLPYYNCTVTAAGITAMLENSPQPPPLNKARRRYREYLEADSGMPFKAKMTRKLFLCPWFGPLPPWFDQYLANIELLKPLGYDWLITTNISRFRQRCGDILGFVPPVERGTGKIHDLRPALGHLFQDELAGYDYWGHTDFDCVYGRVDHFLPDSEIAKWDILSNHHNYISGPWSLYRNSAVVNALYRQAPCVSEPMMEPATNGWVEGRFYGGYSYEVDRAHDAGRIQRRYFFHQSKNPDDMSQVRMESGILTDGGDEIMMAHFNHLKKWPEGVRL